MQEKSIEKFIFSPDSSRVISRSLDFKEDRSPDIVRKVLACPKKKLNIDMNQLLRDYFFPHRNILRIFNKHINILIYKKINNAKLSN